MAGGPPAAQSSDRCHGKHPPDRILHRQAVFAGRTHGTAGIARDARVRNAAAPAHEPHAATAVAGHGGAVPLQPTGKVGEFVGAVRYRAWQPDSALHPGIGVHSPLTFDLFDSWMNRSLGGCQYHVTHPGGLSHERFPVNSFEAESRRLARFFRMGHSPGTMAPPPAGTHAEFPFTLDLRLSDDRRSP